MSNLTVSDPTLEAALKSVTCVNCGVDGADHKCGAVGIQNPTTGKITQNSGNIKRVHTGKAATMCIDCNGPAHFNEWGTTVRCAWRQWEVARGKAMETTDLNAVNLLDFASWWAANPTRGTNFETVKKAERRIAAAGGMQPSSPAVVPTTVPNVPNTPAAMAAAGMIVPVPDPEPVVEVKPVPAAEAATVVETVQETVPVVEETDQAAKVRAAREKLRQSGKLKEVRHA